MVRTGECLASGFLGPVKGWGSLVPVGDRVLQLPKERRRWQAAGPRSVPAAHADGDGSLRELDLIEVTAFTESMGPVEAALEDLAGRLRDGGTLLLDFDNLQSPRQLRTVIEGRAGSFDPAGSHADPSQPLLLRRALAAASAAGLWVRDVTAVPTGAEEFAPGFASSLCRFGLLPIGFVDGAAPARYWLWCERRPSLAGSVLLAGGDEAARARTEAALRAFLPDDWEVVTADAIGECAQWNRAVCAARGDLVWFLRAGMQPCERDFDAMSTRAVVGPVRASRNGVEAIAGDVAGVMLPRVDVLTVGPLPEHYDNTCVALEEYTIRLDCLLPRAFHVESELTAPPAPIERPERLVAETEALLATWSEVAGGDTNEQQSCGVIDPVPPGPESARPPAVPRVGRAPRISLCMIARDESRFLAQCLAHARGAFDEFVLVDTGSTDDTVAIAEAHGAKVLHSPWDDDFSAPRNVGLEAATGDWILVLDADEFLHDGAAERIRELVQNPDALGYHLHFVNNYGTGRTMGVMMVRLFRNLPGIAYENVIHEQVTPSLQRAGEPLGLQLLRSDVEVEHHGYSDAVMQDRGKNERNERLFRKQLERQPDDIYAHYKFGDFLRRVPGRDVDARRYLDRCFELILAASPTLPRSLPYAGEVAALCALEAERVGDRDRAREVVDTALRRFVATPNLHYIAASLAIADREPDTAIHHYRRCLAYRDAVLVVPVQEGITGHVSFAGIAQAWLLRGDRERARRLLEQAIRLEPSYEVAQMALSRLWLEAGDVTRALAVLTRFLELHPDSAGACQQTMLILHRIGESDAARAMGEHTVRLLEARCLEREAAAVTELLAKI